MKRLFLFDLDGTLAQSKAPLTPAMGALLARLLDVAQVAVISGGAWPQFQTQLLPGLPADARLERLSLLPTCGTRFLQRKDGDWTLLYAEDFTPEEKAAIVAALNAAFDRSGLRPQQHWGEFIEDRGGQITLSALGQQAPLEAKTAWDPDRAKRGAIAALLAPMIPQFSVRLGGSTSVDITRPGIDKAYGVGKLREVLGIAIDEMLFFGDALFPGGNDYPAMQAGVQSIPVRDPLETAHIVEAMLACIA